MTETLYGTVQVQRRGDVWGFTLLLERGESSWCSPWIAAEGAASAIDAHEYADEQYVALCRAFRGE